MKKLISIPIILIIIQSLNAQVYKEGSKIIDIGYLFTNTGQGVQVDASLINKYKNIHRCALSFDNGKIGKATTTYNVFKLEYSHLYSICLNDITNFNAGGGAFASFESLKNDMLNQSKSKFSPGAHIVLEAEMFYYKLGLFIAGSQLYRPLSIIGDWEYRFTIGLKYSL
jgi:hypothetical protein